MNAAENVEIHTADKFFHHFTKIAQSVLQQALLALVRALSVLIQFMRASHVVCDRS